VAVSHEKLATKDQQTPAHGAVVPLAGINLAISFPSSHVVLVQVAGEIDEASSPRLAAVLEQCVRSQRTTVVLDAAAVHFLAVAGLELLAQIHARALTLGVRLRVVTGSTAVRRALRASGLDNELTCHAQMHEAVGAEGSPDYSRAADECR
jgi:anti-anti-sigma factor